MTEDLLHFIWKYQLFDKKVLKSTNDEAIYIEKPGSLNTDSGPDFFNAAINISGTLWCGNIEIHIKSSDWFLHKHQNDRAYNNVILHVVAEHDKEIILENGRSVSTLVIEPLKAVVDEFLMMQHENSWPWCKSKIHDVDEHYISMSFQGLLFERLQRKGTYFLQLLHANNNNWNETFYQALARGYGMNVNTDPFEMLARSIPLNILAKHKDSIFQIEALLFGQAGFLNDQLLGDTYFIELRNEYSFLASKYGLKAIDRSLWKFMRLRPRNFPTVRIAQFASLIHRSESLLSKIIEIESLQKLRKMFQNHPSEYWDTHFSLNKSTKKQSKSIGKTSIDHILINTICPFLFVYADALNLNNLKSRVIEFMEHLQPEQNKITQVWKNCNININNAFESQALIELYQLYCKEHRCTSCKIGVKILKSQI